MKRNVYIKRYYGDFLMVSIYRLHKAIHNTKVTINTDGLFDSLRDVKKVAKDLQKVSPHTKIHIRAVSIRGRVFYRLHYINRYSERERLRADYYMLPF